MSQTESSHGSSVDPPIRGSSVRTSSPSNSTAEPLAPGGESSKANSASNSTPEGGAPVASPPRDGEATVISNRPPIGAMGHDPAARLAELGAQLEGRQLGQFALQRLVGGGGMGAVFRAVDLTLNRDVAVKVLSRHQSADEEMLKRFKNEAQSAARLDHENIARVFFVGEDQGLNYIVFEFVEGANLRDLVAQKGVLPFDEAISFTLQVAEALAHASQRDVIHRDIKPSNVIITPEGKAKIVDMGLARLHQVEQTHDLTASGVTLGTFDYISPEQARDPRIADIRSDLYSLGCSLYYMLAGAPPYPEGTVLQKLLAHQESDPPDPRERRPDTPSELVRITRKLMAKDPNKRHQLAEELIADLLVVGERLGIAPVHTPIVPRVKALQRRSAWWEFHLPWLVPLAALLAIVLLLDRYWGHGNLDEATAFEESRSAAASNSIEQPREREPAPTGDRSERSQRPTNSRSNESSRAPAAGERSAASTTSANSPNAHLSSAAGNTDARTATTIDPSTLGLANPLDTITLAAAMQRPEVQSLLAQLSKVLSTKSAGDTAASANASTLTTEPQVLVVSNADEGENSFLEIGEACKRARSGDIIELRFNGVRPERSIVLKDMKLTIRAGQGYSPVVSLRPEAVDVFNASAAMIRVTGGQLALKNICLEMAAPPQPGEWALLEVQQADLRLEQTALTIRHESAIRIEGSIATFIDVKPPASAGTMTMLTTGVDEPALYLELSDCLARGDATLIRADELQPIRLNWSNGLFASRERLLKVMSHGAGRSGGAVSAALRNVTVATRGGLALLSYGDAMRYPLKTEFACRDCVFLNGPTGRDGPPLIEQLSSGDPIWTQMLFVWQGDHNLYDGIDVFWRIANSSLPSSPKQLAFDDWRSHWGERGELAPRRGGVAWRRLPPPEKPNADHLPNEYAFTDLSDIGKASATDTGERRVAGAILDRLPIPAENSAAKPSQLPIDRKPRNISASLPAG